MTRCSWVKLSNPRYVAYHDTEWGVPEHDDRRLYELFILETFQAGLSWGCVLNKREAFREAYEGFAPERVAAYGRADEERLLATPGIIRNRLKIAASISNSRVFLDLQRQFGSFDAYLQSVCGSKVIMEPCTLRTTSELSDRLSADLRRRGMRFVGSTTIYSFLQACGVINGHEPQCCCHPSNQQL